MRRFRSRSRGPRRRQHKEWEGGASSGLIDTSDIDRSASSPPFDPGEFAAVKQAAWVINPIEMAQQFDTPTLLMTTVHGHMLTDDNLAGLPAGEGPFIYAAGLILWKGASVDDGGDQSGDDAVPANAPNPANGDLDWIWRFVVPLTNDFGVGIVEVEGTDSIESNCHSKAKRKFPVGTGILSCFSFTDLGAGASDLSAGPIIQDAYDFRFLLLNN